MGDYARAEPLYRQALEIRRKVLGEQHPDYAASLNNLAVLYESMDDYARAEPLYRQALEIRKTALGEAHPYYATSLNNLAVLYHSMGDYARAERSIARPSRSGGRCWGATSGVCRSLSSLAVLYRTWATTPAPSRF